MPNSSPDDIALTLAGLIFETTVGLKRILAGIHDRYDLSGSDFDALLRLNRSEGHRLRMIDLAAQTAMSTSGVTRLADRLDDAGLIERQPDPHDRRSSHLSLTEAGQELTGAVATETAAAIDEALIQPLGPSATALIELLEVARDLTHPSAATITGQSGRA